MQILVLEKSAMIRRFIREELAWSGYTVLEAETPDEARELLMSEKDIAMLTLGTVLDGIDGFDFLEEINSSGFQKCLAPLNNDNLVGVFVTANDNDAERLRGYHIGAADFIQKPWARGDFLARVDSILGRSAEMQGMSVLVVDDSRTSLRFVHSCLERLGVTVYDADDGDTALAFLREHAVDLVLTDLNMVHMNGDELCLHIRRELHLPDLPVIFLSATEDKATILSLFKIGATDYLTKPFIQEELMARLKVHLAHAVLINTVRELTDLEEESAQATVDLDDEFWGKGAGTKVTAPHWRVLLVDDSEVNRTIGAKLLRKMGCEVEVASSGQTAIEAFKEGDGKRFDLVLMDLMMPVMDGIETTRQIRSWENALAANSSDYGPPVPIVALTASSQDKQLAVCLEAGMNDFLNKPFRLDRVRAALRRWAKVPVGS